MTIRSKIKKTRPCITSSKPQCADVLHIVYNAHVYGPMETTMTITSCTQQPMNEQPGKLLY